MNNIIEQMLAQHRSGTLGDKKTASKKLFRKSFFADYPEQAFFRQQRSTEVQLYVSFTVLTGFQRTWIFP